MDGPTIIGFLTLLLGILGLAWQVQRSKADAKAMSDGVAKLADVVTSNQQILQAVVSEFSQHRSLSIQQLALEQNRLKLQQLKMLGGAFRFLMENNDQD